MRSLLFNSLLISLLMFINTIPVNSSITCNIYLQSPLLCINSTSLVKCRYDLEENRCLEINQRNLGCSSNLNKEACIYQLTNEKGQDVNCIFLERCQPINNVQLQRLTCSDKINKLGCMNLPQKECVWNNRCQNLDNNSNLNNCYTSNLPVTPYTCQQSKLDLCMSNGDFRCIEVRIDQLSTITCNQQGLNEKACIAITTMDQKCIFENKRCKSIESSQITSCNLILNIHACLSPQQNNKLLCEWFESSCRAYQNIKSYCPTKNIVSSSVCSNSNGFCMYNEKEKRCQIIQKDKIHSLNCDTIGLSKEGCLKVKNKNCSFYGGKCQELNEQDLKSYLCNMELNEQACVNLETEFQYCKWNGSNCERIFMNQDIDCPDLIKVNGNVCQAISKSDVLCKYDQNTNFCVASTNYDECNTPFLNLLGCISIQNHHQTCQWYQNKCTAITIQLNITKCETLQYVNPYSCSQVYESDSLGCYYDQNSYQCKSIQIDSNQDLLNTISCKDVSLGINKVLCASLTTPVTPCRWYQEQCSYIHHKKDIANVPCMSLQHANYQACSLASYNDEPCIYSEKPQGCNSFIKEETKCETKGLNAIGCIQIKKDCYFDKIICIKKQEIDFIPNVVAKINDQTIIQLNYYDNEECNSVFLTKVACSSITKKGETCIWSFKLNSCTEISIKYNESCLTYSGAYFIINPNVCASILKDVPEFCAFDAKTKNCKIQYYDCKTKCCTEYNMIGINAHSCSRYSNKTEGVYCYFHNYRCQELTVETVDISDEAKVKKYYNDLKLPCSSMNKNSCLMIDWSTSQLCYYNGEVCNNLNLQLYPNLKIFTEEPSKLNEYACLAIEATESTFNKLKYFTYDSGNHRCQEFKVNPEYTFANCELVKGNKNICTRYTGDNRCKWDPQTLKCKTIDDEVFDEIQICNSNVNKKACLENKFSNCYFSIENDSCLEIPEDVKCDQFYQKGFVKQSVCKTINVLGQKCSYSEDKQTCIKSEQNYEDCEISKFDNNRVCYDSTSGQCRWDQTSLICYQNYTDISELNCDDNLNRVLCLKVTKEACIWNVKQYQCQIFQYDPEVLKDSYNLINEKACLSIQGAGYYYERENNVCQRLYIFQYPCDYFQMNQYACLYLTRGHFCFYDSYESIPNIFCKFFMDEQSICNTYNLINIEVCMNLPVSCLFNESTLKCESIQVNETDTCSQLFDQSKNNKHHNKIACASVRASQTEPPIENSCYKESGVCRFEKNCYWVDYTCKIYEFRFRQIEYYPTDGFWDGFYLNCNQYQNYCQYQETSNEYQKNDPKINITIEYENWYYFNYRTEYYSEQSFTCKQNEFIDCKNINCYGSYDYFYYFDGMNQQIYNYEEYEEFSDDSHGTSAYRYLSSTDMFIEAIYSLTPQISKKIIILIQYQNSLSKALCLKLKGRDYIFDLNQGGCIQSKNNEHKIPNCESISNNCHKSQSKSAICKDEEQSGNQFQRLFSDQNNNCKTLDDYQSKYNCDNIKKDSQPILCAKAQDICRFDGTKCVNTDPEQCECDKSYSKELCEKCNCDYMFLGYCQQNKEKLLPQLNEDSSNQYYLCYEVTEFVAYNQEKVCAQVDQACKFKDNKCEDATHSTCAELIPLIVSQQACIRCQGQPMKYNKSTYRCEPISEKINECENLNKNGCLSYSEKVKCKWNVSLRENNKKVDFECQEIKIDQLDQLDCAILNYDACNEQQINLCWFDKETQLCMKYNPLKGECSSYMNNSTCIQSMVESCIWTNKSCQIASEQQECEGFNKFGCLHFKHKSCVWFDDNHKCQSAKFIDQPKNCTDLIQYDILHMNAFTCTSMNIEKPCILAKNYKCREIIEPILYQCETIGLNKSACILKTKNKCAFLDNKCISIDTNKEGCKDYLNENACLNQKQGCIFYNGKCQGRNFTDFNELIINKDYANATYSSRICQFIDDGKTGYIYSKIQKKCVKVENLNTNLTDCSLPGINKQACLNQIQSFCEYKNDQCQYINKEKIDSCSNKLNKFACTQVDNISCKFENNECREFTKDQQFYCNQSQLNVNEKICFLDKTNPCIYDNKERICDIVDPQQLEKCEGLNEEACINNSGQLLCEFIKSENKCQSSYGYSFCEDQVNKNKCLAITTKGQYCRFKDKKCQKIDESTIQNLNGEATNPITCSKIKGDVAYFYDKKSHMCIEFKDYDNDENCYPQNYQVSNIDSFNKNTCVQFQEAIYLNSNTKLPVSLLWKDGCAEIKSVQLLYLRCNEDINRNTCVNIITPKQYCQFIGNKCVNADLNKFQNQICDQIKNINSGVFCAKTTGDACRFNQQQYKCEFVEEQKRECLDKIQSECDENIECFEQKKSECYKYNEKIECVEENPEKKGYNEEACQLDAENCVFSDQCYKVKKDQLQFCQNALDQEKCSKVLIEGCKIIDNICLKIQDFEYENLQCEEAINQIGCVNIQTKDQYCQFVEQKCVSHTLSSKTSKECKKIQDINHYRFCELTTDLGCIYDFQLNSCNIVPEDQYLTCQRGINKIACLQQTDKNLKCQFLDYCQDSDSGIQNCKFSNNDLCCKLAVTIENCLIQNIYNCQWQDNKCQGYPQNEQKKCDDIYSSSLLVCTSIQDDFCIYDKDKHKCIVITPDSCEDLKSSGQCNRMSTLPCIWHVDRQQCIYMDNQQKSDSGQLSCGDVKVQSGSQRACMNIELQGQMCIFKDHDHNQDYKCETFQQTENQNNCLDNININSCLQQTISDCYWKLELLQVNISPEKDKQNVQYGKCIAFEDIDKIDCHIHLSYTSCLKISKEGVFCIWKNQQCQAINDDELIVYKSSSFTQINSNTCGLINNGDKVQYDKNIYQCVKVQDIRTVSCSTEGLNKEACLNIEKQDCLWDVTKRKCKQYKLIPQSTTCKILNVSSQLCTYIKLEKPCGFIKDGCDFVNLDQVKCNSDGLNKYACLNVQEYPCIWVKNMDDEKYHCEDFIPTTPCEKIPKDINSKVCSLVQEDSCYYNKDKSKCEVPNKDQTNCELVGLNSIGCVQIENCFFDQKCQLLDKNIYKNYKCDDFPIANKLICKNAIDSCKYNEIQYGCSSANDELCSNDSLSDIACQNQPQCILLAQGCQCRRFIETYDCNYITEITQCQQLSHCKLQNNDVQQNQICRQLTCEDFKDECDRKIILNSICYWSDSIKCLSASKCEEIINPFYQCQQYSFNNLPCQSIKGNVHCQQFKCENFEKDLCLQYEEYCKFEKFCKRKQCSDLTYQQCIQNNCDWNYIKESCGDLIECEQIQNQELCNQQQFYKRSCFWIEMKDKQICVEHKCNYLQKQQICAGSRVAHQTCVELSKSICASCEEISDSCECLGQSDYCQYDIDNRKCTSKKCESYSTELQCPFEFCIFQDQKCQTKCEIIKNQFNCKQTKNCDWIESIYKCNINCIKITKSEICDQNDHCNWDDVEQQCQEFKNEPVNIIVFIGTKMIFPIFALISLILI